MVCYQHFFSQKKKVEQEKNNELAGAQQNLLEKGEEIKKMREEVSLV